LCIWPARKKELEDSAVKNRDGQEGFATLIVLALTAVLLSVMTAALRIGSTVHGQNKRFKQEIIERVRRLEAPRQDSVHDHE